MTKFNLTTAGRATLTVQIKPVFSQTMLPIPFKLDTGADSTTISKKTLDALGYDKSWRERYVTETAKVSGAGSKEKIHPVIRLPKLNLLGLEFIEWPFIFAEDADVDFRELCGINMLHLYNFNFSYREWALFIEPEYSPLHRLELRPGAQVMEVMQPLSATKNLFSPVNPFSDPVRRLINPNADVNDVT